MLTGNSVGAQNSASISVLLGLGNGTFPTHTEYLVPQFLHWLGLADLDGDGHLDLVYCSTKGTWMRRKHQPGWIRETPGGMWRVHWLAYILDPRAGIAVRHHRSRVLGDKRGMRKFEAEAELARLMAAVNANSWREPRGDFFVHAATRASGGL